MHIVEKSFALIVSTLTLCVCAILKNKGLGESIWWHRSSRTQEREGQGSQEEE